VFQLLPPGARLIPDRACSAARALVSVLGFMLCFVSSGGAAPLRWQPSSWGRWAALDVPGSGGQAGFTRLAPAATGVAFTNLLDDASVAVNRIFENGSGVALGDVDGDGWCDVYFCSLEGSNTLYRNLGGWKFEDITARAGGIGLARQYATGAVLADVDGDGDLDLLVNSIGGGTRCWHNDGTGRFTEVTGTRLVRRFGSTSMALADIDGDRDLDLYVTNYRTTTYKDRPPGLQVEARLVEGRVVVTPADRFIPVVPRAGGVEVIERGERDFLYLNDNGRDWGPVSWTAGSFLDEAGAPLREAPMDWGLSVMFRDFNGDGLPDIFVCNDFVQFPDRLWLNEESRRFRAASARAWRSMSLASMAVDVADINRDGYDDFFVADMVSERHEQRQRQRPMLMRHALTQASDDPDVRPEVPRNTLFLNRGDQTFAEIALLSGVAYSEWTWSAIFLDVDLDGYEDLLVATGNNHDVQDADVLRDLATLRATQRAPSGLEGLRRFPRLAAPKRLFRNRGDLSFEEAGARWGFHEVEISHGMALADLDNDGDLDVVVNNLHSSAAVYRNDSSAPRVAVRLRGRGRNTRGIGARLRLTGGPVAQSQEMIAGGRYLSSDDAMRTFAAGSEPMTLEVHWRAGGVTTVRDVHAQRLYEIAEPEAADPTHPPSPASIAARSPFFSDMSGRLSHRHTEAAFDGWSQQPLLSHRLDRLGQGVAWGDFNGDGWDDLAVGSGRAGAIAVWRNTGEGGFAPLSGDGTNWIASDDVMGLVWSAHSTTRATLLAARASLESTVNSAPSGVVLVVEPDAASRAASPLAFGPATPGPVALSDWDGDGAMDLFVGGRFRAGRYPEPVGSRWYRQAPDGAWRSHDKAGAMWQDLGLVSGAVFADLDANGRDELILACDWGPIRVFRHHAGRIEELTERLGFGGHTGWWNGVAAGDFDGDGRLDIVATNWGRNTRYQPYRAHPIRMFWGDWDRNGTIELLETVYDSGLQKVVPWRDYETVVQAIPTVALRLPSFRAYGLASVHEVLGDHASQARISAATTLDSMVFLNRPDRFEPRSLPVEAQFTPAFGVAVSDFDGDGAEDVFLSQNFFGTEPETARFDGGRGLWLRGDGKGGFVAVSAQESGIEVYGEQRGCAVADYDQDGRPDLIVAQNRGATRLFRNVGGRPGLRVRLEGSASNPTGVGATLRLKQGATLGPVRAVSAGSGYLSQNSAVQVLALDSGPATLQVRWPGGRVAELPVPPGTRELRVRE
jgi:hypothetical protein